MSGTGNPLLDNGSLVPIDPTPTSNVGSVLSGGVPSGMSGTVPTQTIQPGQPGANVTNSPPGQTLDPITGFPTDEQTGAPLPGNTSTAGAGAAQGTAGSTGGGVLDAIWEALSRMGLILIGLALVMLALAGMIWHAKSVTVPASTLRGDGGNGQ